MREWEGLDRVTALPWHWREHGPALYTVWPVTWPRPELGWGEEGGCTDLGMMSELRISTSRLGGNLGMGGSGPRERDDLPLALRLWPCGFAVRLLLVSRDCDGHKNGMMRRGQYEPEQLVHADECGWTSVECGQGKARTMTHAGTSTCRTDGASCRLFGGTLE